MKKHYIIGDVHGEYKTLLALLEKIPKDSEIIFVGDIVDRGLKSREVVTLVREKGYRVVKGNHENTVSKCAESFIEFLEHKRELSTLNPRCIKESSRLATYFSYGLVTLDEDGNYGFNHDNIEGMKQLKEDALWMRELPIYIELDAKHHSGKKVVVSHSHISHLWHLRHDKNQEEAFAYDVMWNRETKINEEANLFNVYGHTPQEHEVKITPWYAIVDTGCCFGYPNRNKYGRLSAYCVESGEVVEVKKYKEKEKI